MTPTLFADVDEDGTYRGLRRADGGDYGAHLVDQADAADAGDTVDGEVDYSTMTVPELKAELDDRGIEYTSDDLKADLVGLLEDDDGNE